jgi:peptidoglycan hydrolase-like protein with peptidoglycan-binding domain
VGWALALLVGVAGGWWAAEATFSRPVSVAADSAPLLYTVQTGTVGRSLSFSAQARWPATPAALNAASGTVTHVLARGDRLGEGAVLYRVDLRPVVIAQGRVPSFRDLGVGAVGADVEQLERLLSNEVPFPGTVDQEFTEVTKAAVQAWQTQLGVEADGRVRREDIVFVPRLPARILLSRDIRVGSSVSAGSGSVDIVRSRPQVTVTLSTEQRDLVPLDGAVIVHHGNGSWTGKVASTTTTDQGELILELAGRDGGPICGRRCNRIPVGRTSVYRTELVAVEPRTGPVVPSAALRTTAAGDSVVIDAAGAEIKVQVLAAAGGQAVVEGVDVGQRIRLFGQRDPAAPQPT